MVLHSIVGGPPKRNKSLKTFSLKNRRRSSNDGPPRSDSYGGASPYTRTASSWNVKSINIKKQKTKSTKELKSTNPMFTPQFTRRKVWIYVRVPSFEEFKGKKCKYYLPKRLVTNMQVEKEEEGLWRKQTTGSLLEYFYEGKMAPEKDQPFSQSTLSRRASKEIRNRLSAKQMTKRPPLDMSYSQAVFSFDEWLDNDNFDASKEFSVMVDLPPVETRLEEQGMIVSFDIPNYNRYAHLSKLVQNRLTKRRLCEIREIFDVSVIDNEHLVHLMMQWEHTVKENLSEDELLEKCEALDIVLPYKCSSDFMVNALLNFGIEPLQLRSTATIAEDIAFICQQRARGNVERADQLLKEYKFTAKEVEFYLEQYRDLFVELSC